MLVLDFETRARVDLKTCGVSRYVSCPEFGVLVVAVKFDGTPATAIYRGNPDNPAINQELIRRISSGEKIIAHNVGFDYRVYEQYAPLMGWPKTHINQWICTQTAAMAAGLPSKLNDVGKALGLGEKKASGTRLINQLSCPDSKTGQFCNDTKKLKPFVEYALQDVELTALVAKALWPCILNSQTPFELALQEADFRMNSRGIAIDRKAVVNALALNEKMTTVLDAAMAQTTGGMVTSTTGTPSLLRYARQWFPSLVSVDKEAVDTLRQRPDTPPELRKALNIRKAGSKTSVKKYQAMLNCLGIDGRIRDTLRLYGAFTGRWAGRIVQTHNLPKGDIDGHDNASLAESLSVYGSLPKGVPWAAGLSAAIRGCIVAEPGSALLVSDYAAIECRILAWLARCEKLLKVFATKGGDPYKPMAASILGKAVEEITKGERAKWGKATILGCGYGMGTVRFAKENKMPEEDAAICVNKYRTDNPEVPMLWRTMERAAISAVLNPGQAFAGSPECNVVFCMDGDFLTCELPSGRKLFYWRPSVQQVDKWGEGKLQWELSYWGKSSTTNSLVRITTWGGTLVENVCQAIARDVIGSGIIESLRRGLSIILQVHDEAVAEVVKDRASELIRTLEDCLLHRQTWMTDLPLEVESWYGPRYKK